MEIEDIGCWEVDAHFINRNNISLLMKDHSYDCDIHKKDGKTKVVVRQNEITLLVEDFIRYNLLKDIRGGITEGGREEIRAPMPGNLLSINVEPGSKVETGQAVAIIEAMKMENEIRSLKGGTVKEILVEPGVRVEKDQLLVVIE